MDGLNSHYVPWRPEESDFWLSKLFNADADALGIRFRAAQPFPHLIVDDLFPANLLEAIAAEFELLSVGRLRRNYGPLHRKLGTAPNAALPMAAQRYFDLIYSGPFLRFLTQITGIEHLIPDPGLYGGGLHIIPTGGRFDVHTDFKRHPKNKLDNRLVMITYLNQGWREEFGGALELWRQQPPERVVSVLPEFGRTVLMLQSGRSAHGHPVPVAAPDGRDRISAAAYFYTNGREDGEAEHGRSTNYKMGTTKFVRRPGRTGWQSLELLVRQTVPPIIVNGVTSIASKLHNHAKRDK